MTNPFIETADAARTSAANEQDRNRKWWEIKPMTYADWSAEDRIPGQASEFLELESYVRRTGPWLYDWFSEQDFEGVDCLDLGSGSGIFSSFLARRHAHVTAVDLTQTGTNLTRATTQFFECDVAVVRGDAETIPFADKTFDFIFSWGVLHHTHDMDAAVKEAARVLKPGGRGMMMVYNKNSVVYYAHGLYWLIAKGKIFKGYSLRTVQDFYTDGFYHRYLTAKGLGGILNSVGLSARKFSVTQYEKKIIPGIPYALDRWMKSKFGMCLIAEFEKPR